MGLLKFINVGLVELMIPFLCVMQMRKKEKEKEVFTLERCEDLEELYE